MAPHLGPKRAENGREAGAQEASPGPTYYLDSEAGDDSLGGTSPQTAWKSLARAQAASLVPGASVLFKRGGDWTGQLTLASSGSPGEPILIGAYGRGELPRLHGGGCLDLQGSYLVVQALHTDACTWAGISISGHHNVVRDSASTGNVAGIYVRPGATSNQILGNQLRDNNRMSVLTPEPGGDSGAWGVLLRGDDTEVAYNVVRGSDSFSYDFARDGAAFEIYGARNNRIHHNRAYDNNMFSELGHARSAGNVFAYNVVVSNLERGGFLTTRGAASSYGPVLATELYNNSVLLGGELSEGIVCHAGCGPEILRMRNNVIQAVRKVGYADAPFDEGFGLYHGGRVQFALGPGSQVLPPGFAHPGSADLHLEVSSPGIDAGDQDASNASRDIDGNVVPADGTGDGRAVVDVGAYELVPGSGDAGPGSPPEPEPEPEPDTGSERRRSIGRTDTFGIGEALDGLRRLGQRPLG